MAQEASGDAAVESSLKEKINELFNAGNYLKAAATYTRDIKLDPSNPTLYRVTLGKGAYLKQWRNLILFSKSYPQSSEVSRKIKRIEQLAKEKKLAEEVENLRYSFDLPKHLGTVKSELAFESPLTHSECFSFLRQCAEDSFARASCLVASISVISYPQVWKGQGTRKWKHDGFFVQ